MVTAAPERAVVAVIGVSPKVDRYAHSAFQMLRRHHYRAVPVNPGFSEISGERCYACLSQVPGPIDTVTLYVRKVLSDGLVADILEAKPRRIIMNPGAENADLARDAEEAGITVVEGCTLVMLRTGTF